MMGSVVYSKWLGARQVCPLALVLVTTGLTLGQHPASRMKTEPRLMEIKDGWAARGEGWAVHAPTREEAIHRFRKAELRHEKIRQQPPFYQQ